MKNWRPLSLLNTDYKILTKALASRLQAVIPELVSPNQTGYIKGRYIGDNIRTIYDIIEFSSLKNLPGMIVMLDFEKAFDSISWQFLFRTLEAFNFGPVFQKWVKIIYETPQCCITNNGFSSTFFPLTKGIHQGCPISALLFLLVAEIMAINIRKNKEIKGITCNHETLTISQLADDTTLFLRDRQSLAAALTLIDDFGKSSGLRLNKDKCEAFWIGSEINNASKLCNIEWICGTNVEMCHSLC